MKIGLRIILFLSSGLVFADYAEPPKWNGDGLGCLPPSHPNITECSYNSEFEILDVNINEGAQNVILCYVDCTNCGKEGDITIGSFTIGNKALLEPIITRKDDRWYVNITKAQDYESAAQRIYKFEIIVGQEKNKWVKIAVNDLDDTAPVVDVDQKTCIIPENEVGPSNCTYQIYDPDSDVMDITFQFVDTNIDRVNDLFNVTLEKITKSSAKGTLNVLSPLNYENVSMYIININAKDRGGNKGSAFLTVEVADRNDNPPRWVHIFATETFPEEMIKDFYISATDGDVTLNATINFEFYETCHENISIDVDTGKIHVNTVDRDVLENDFITCMVRAYEKDDPDMQVNATITFLILDINDNPPVITVKESTLIFPENEYMTFEHVANINDIDLGVNATYTAELVDDGSSQYGWSDAFQIIPSSAYRDWNFSLTIKEPASLDYENVHWRDFTIKIVAKDSAHQSESKIHIKLLNRNDEVPKFTEDIYQVSVREDVPVDTPITIIHAEDADADDSVVYRFTSDYLTDSFVINKTSGEIKTKVNNVFNYEKQTQLIIQVQVDDTLKVGNESTHTTYAQVAVTVIDVNDEPPRLTLPIQRIEVPENQSTEFLVTNEIVATDPDTGANLTFRIDWHDSNATKQGSLKDLDEFEGVFKIETKFRDPKKKGSAYAELKSDQHKKLNYELFDVVYLQIVVEDVDQHSNNVDSATLTVAIKDVNDNAPVFDPNSISSKKTVIEKSDINTLIATVIAEDADGHEYNKIRYSLVPTFDTPNDLVKIDERNGQLLVVSKNIDADQPRYNLTYIVNATDGELWDTQPIIIYIEDTNDQVPTFEEKQYENKTVKEQTSQMYLEKITCTDRDRKSRICSLTCSKLVTRI